MKALILTAALTSALALTAGPALAQTAPAATPPMARPVAQPVSQPTTEPANQPAAAGTIPNTFDGPPQAAAPRIAGAAPAAAPPVTAAEIGPDVARAETALRDLIGAIQGEGLDYAVFSEGLAARIRQQEATLLPVIKGFGALKDATYVGQEQGADLFALDFENARTQWIIGFNAEDEIALLLFRPAPDPQ